MPNEITLSQAVARLMLDHGRRSHGDIDQLLDLRDEIARTRDLVALLRIGEPYFVALHLLDLCLEADVVCFDAEFAVRRLGDLFACDRGLSSLADALTVVSEYANDRRPTTT